MLNHHEYYTENTEKTQQFLLDNGFYWGGNSLSKERQYLNGENIYLFISDRHHALSSARKDFGHLNEYKYLSFEEIKEKWEKGNKRYYTDNTETIQDFLFCSGYSWSTGEVKQHLDKEQIRFDYNTKKARPEELDLHYGYKKYFKYHKGFHYITNDDAIEMIQSNKCEKYKFCTMLHRKYIKNTQETIDLLHQNGIYRCGRLEREHYSGEYLCFIPEYNGYMYSNGSFCVDSRYKLITKQDLENYLKEIDRMYNNKQNEQVFYAEYSHSLVQMLNENDFKYTSGVKNGDASFTCVNFKNKTYYHTNEDKSSKCAGFNFFFHQLNKSTRICIINSEYVQLFLFKCGYRWENHFTKPKCLNSKYITIDTENLMLFGHNPETDTLCLTTKEVSQVVNTLTKIRTHSRKEYTLLTEMLVYFDYEMSKHEQYYDGITFYLDFLDGSCYTDKDREVDGLCRDLKLEDLSLDLLNPLKQTRFMDFDVIVRDDKVVELSGGALKNETIGIHEQTIYELYALGNKFNSLELKIGCQTFELKNIKELHELAVSGGK